MACCKRSNTRLVNQLSLEENELDVISRASTVPTESGREDEEEDDPDSLTTTQVATSVALITIFAICFATSFCFLTAAKNSLKSDFVDANYSCSIVEIDAENEINCGGTSEVSPCIDVKLTCKGIENRTLTMYQFYHDYYSTDRCSTTRCLDPDRVYTSKITLEEYKFPLSLIQRCCTINGTGVGKNAYSAGISEEDLYADTPFKTGDTFQYDRNKPDAIFYNRSEEGTTRLVLSRPLSYVILALPQTITVLIVIFILTLFVNDKLTAKEIYRPLTAITPLHTQVNGKWYIKEVKQDVQMNAFEKLRAQNNS